MKKIILVAGLTALFVSCNQKENKKAFVVKGKVSNSAASMIYLEYLPMATDQRMVIDSAKLSKNGTYTLGADQSEAAIYNLRLDHSNYPFASVINDVPEVTVDVAFNNENKEFPEKYEVKNSPASSQLKDFMIAFNGQLQGIFFRKTKIDTLQRQPGNDSLIQVLNNEKKALNIAAKKLFDENMQRSTNPALSMFMLGFYQPAASIPEYELTPLTDEEVKKIVDDLATKFPNHSRLAQIKQSFDGASSTAWVGKPSPEIALPDPDGKIVKLSSFRGKYVLVDFWASWCGPCRMENPNVVAAFQKFKNKNFTILGVSLDRPGQKDKWLGAVMKDKLTWTQVSDLLEWQSPVVETFGFGQQGIPYNFLVDPNGIIIAERLRGPALDAKLAEVLK